LNTFTTQLLKETINAVRELNDDPETVFTVLTGEGRYFSAGADITSTIFPAPSLCFKSEKAPGQF
jgi:peroxisomal 3,2-trans-enoyl-CoA isomerase